MSARVVALLAAVSMSPSTGCSDQCGAKDMSCMLSRLALQVDGKPVATRSIGPGTIHSSQLGSGKTLVIFSPPTNAAMLQFAGAADTQTFPIEVTMPPTGAPVAMSLDLLVDIHELGINQGELGLSSGDALPLLAFTLPAQAQGMGTIGVTPGFNGSASFALDFSPIAASDGGDAITEVLAGRTVALGSAMSVAGSFPSKPSGGMTGAQVCAGRGQLFCNTNLGPQDAELQLDGVAGFCAGGCSGIVGYVCVFAQSSQGSPGCFPDVPSATQACPNNLSIARCTN